MYIGNTNKRQRTQSEKYAERRGVYDGSDNIDIKKSGENTPGNAHDVKGESESENKRYEYSPRRKTFLPSPPPNYGGVLYNEKSILNTRDESAEEADNEITYAEGITRLAQNDSTLRCRKKRNIIPATAEKPERCDCECDVSKDRNSGFEALVNGLSHNNFTASDILFGAVILLMLNGNSDDDILLILILMLLL